VIFAPTSINISNFSANSCSFGSISGSSGNSSSFASGVITCSSDSFPITPGFSPSGIGVTPSVRIAVGPSVETANTGESS